MTDLPQSGTELGTFYWASLGRGRLGPARAVMVHRVGRGSGGHDWVLVEFNGSLRWIRGELLRAGPTKKETTK